MNIYQKLIEVRKSVPYLQKDAQMKQGDRVQYNYNSSSQVIGAVRKELDDKNLLLITKIIDKRVHMDTVENTDNSGKVKRTTTFFTELDLMMVWVNGDEPTEQLEVPWYGQGIDTAGEKGVGKALTYAEKTFLLKQFNIATDQMDVDAYQDKMDKTVGKITSNAIAQLKSEWIGSGYKANALGVRVKELYKCAVTDLTEDQAVELLDKIRAKKGQSA